MGDREGHYNVAVVRLDDFYSPNLGRADRVRLLEQVIEPLSKNIKAEYQRYDWGTGELDDWHKIEPGRVVIIEGVTSLHPDLGDKYDLTIWLDVSQEEAFRRGLSRDLNEYKVDNKDKWEKVWIPLEKEYVKLVNPKDKADIILIN